MGERQLPCCSAAGTAAGAEPSVVTGTAGSFGFAAGLMTSPEEAGAGATAEVSSGWSRSLNA